MSFCFHYSSSNFSVLQILGRCGQLKMPTLIRIQVTEQRLVTAITNHCHILLKTISDGWNLPEKSPIVQSTTNSLNQNLSGVVNQAHSIRDINANNVNIYQNSNFFLGFFLVSIFLLLLSVFYVTGGARDEMKD